MGGGASTLTDHLRAYIAHQFSAVAGDDARKTTLTALELCEVVPPRDMPIEFDRAATLFAIDRDHDGLFTLDDLHGFASVCVGQLGRAKHHEHQDRIKAYCDQQVAAALSTAAGLDAYVAWMVRLLRVAFPDEPDAGFHARPAVRLELPADGDPGVVIGTPPSPASVADLEVPGAARGAADRGGAGGPATAGGRLGEAGAANPAANGHGSAERSGDYLSAAGVAFAFQIMCGECTGEGDVTDADVFEILQAVAERDGLLDLADESLDGVVPMDTVETFTRDLAVRYRDELLAFGLLADAEPSGRDSGD